MRSFVNTRFDASRAYEEICQTGINKLAATIADHQDQASCDQHQQQQAQDNLAAIQKGN